MKLSNKVAYLKGLMDGMKIDDSTNEGKVLLMMANILDEMSLSVEAISDEVNEVVELVDILNEDLCDVEEELYFGDDEYDCDCDCECSCDCNDEDDDEYDDYDDDEDYEFEDEVEYECVCPTCGDTICLCESIIEEGSMDCPNCGELLEFDFSEIDEDEEVHIEE